MVTVAFLISSFVLFDVSALTCLPELMSKVMLFEGYPMLTFLIFSFFAQKKTEEKNTIKRFDQLRVFGGVLVYPEYDRPQLIFNIVQYKVKMKERKKGRT